MRQTIKSLLRNSFKEPHTKQSNLEWDIYVGSKHIGTVIYPRDKSAWFIRRDLVYSKGYPGNIEIQEVEVNT